MLRSCVYITLIFSHLAHSLIHSVLNKMFKQEKIGFEKIFFLLLNTSLVLSLLSECAAQGESKILITHEILVLEKITLM